MQANIKVSIITVTLNSEKTIAKTIESVLSQTYTNLEYIIIDGLSNDSTINIAESYRPKFQAKGISYQIVSEPDRGMYDALNKGIKLASGLIIGSINSDDWYEPIAVETVVETYKKRPFEMFYADLRIIDRSKEWVKKAKLKRIISSRYWNHPTTFITKELYDKYQYSLESGYDDFDLMLRIRKDKRNRVVTNSTVIANFRSGGLSTRASFGESIRKIKQRYRVYSKNGMSRYYLLDCIMVELLKFIFYKRNSR